MHCINAKPKGMKRGKKKSKGTTKKSYKGGKK